MARMSDCFLSLCAGWHTATRNGCHLQQSGLLWRPVCCWRSGGWDSTTGRDHGRARAQPPKDDRSPPHLVTHRGGKGFVSPSLKPMGSPVEDNREPPTRMANVGFMAAVSEHSQLCLAALQAKERGHRQYGEFRWQEISRTVDLTSVCRIKDIYWSCRCHGQTLWTQSPIAFHLTGRI